MTPEFYKTFSLIFHMPDREFAGYLKNGFIDDIRFLESDSIAGFSDFLKDNRGKDDERFYNTLAVEYTRLFINATPKVPCPPYESMYRENVIMGDSTMDVMDSFSRAGLKVTENFRDLPDHVAVELEFLYYLRNYGYTEEHVSFMKEHFSKWVPKFCEEVEKNDRIGFYRQAAKVLREFITKEEWLVNNEVMK
ncbi:MAG: molecular chaperone TorD family protein [Candidatus Methanoperedens sp.]|nr:molecular chaperone TorD family protein [Candidatus Methanoperedens sp.]